MRKYIYDLFLFLTYLIAVIIVRYCYPMPQVSWDSNYYLVKSIFGYPGMRPVGYSKFLSILYVIPNLNFVCWVQHALYFVAVWMLLYAIRQFVKLNGIFYYILGVIMLLEPAGLYNGFNILSDSLFSSLTYLYIATLLLYISKDKYLYFIAHLLTIYCCIETRYVALFYPFFSIIVLLVVSRKTFSVKALNTLLVLGVFIGLQQMSKKRNKDAYGVPIAAAFSGWTQANNSLYALPRINIDARYIEDAEMREMHTFFKSHQESGAFIVHVIGSGYMWDYKSPLNILRQKVEDSLNQHPNDGQNWFRSMYMIAPKFNRYGMFIQKNFPYEFLMSFVIPNTGTLITPHDGEMMDYYVQPTVDQVVLDRYKIKNEDFKCRKQIYKDHINTMNLKLYHLRLVLFLVCAVLLVYFRNSFEKMTLMFVSVLAAFVVLYYLLTLYSSWFLPRYLLPVLPVMSAVILICFKYMLENRRILLQRSSSKH